MKAAVAHLIPAPFTQQVARALDERQALEALTTQHAARGGLLGVTSRWKPLTDALNRAEAMPLSDAEAIFETFNLGSAAAAMLLTYSASLRCMLLSSSSAVKLTMFRQGPFEPSSV